MISTLLSIPIFAISLSKPYNEIYIDKVLWGISTKNLENILPNTLNPTTPKEVHSYSNGFGTPKYKFTARVFNEKGTVYALFGGKETNQLISFLWTFTNQKTCENLSNTLLNKLGKPTLKDDVMYTNTWEEISPELEITFRNFTTSCNLLLSPTDPFIYD